MGTRDFSYRDAVRILADEMSGILKLLDRLPADCSSLLARQAVLETLPSFKEKANLVTLSDSLWSDLAEKARGFGAI